MGDIDSNSFVLQCSGMQPPLRLMKRLTTRRSKSVQYNTGDQIDSGHNNLYFEEDKRVSNVSNDQLVKTVNIGEIFWLMFSIISFVSDFGSDIYLMTVYYSQKNFTWFILTLVFVLVPSFIMSLFSVFWYWSDKDSKFSYLGWIIRLGLHLFQLAPLVRYVDTLIYAWKSKYAKTDWDRFRYYKLMIYEEADSSLLRVMECSMESTPQLLLQLYIIFTQPRSEKGSVFIAQIVSSILSLISLSWCLTSYQSSLRLTTPDKAEMKCCSMMTMVLWKVLLILPRFLSIALFTSFYKLHILIVLSFHYLLMASYIIAQKTTYFSPRPFTFKEIIFNLVMSVIYCVDFLNLIEGPTRFRYIFYYGVSFVEITILIILWYLEPLFYLSGSGTLNNTNGSLKKNFYYQHWPDPIRKLVFSLTIIFFVFGIILMIVYFLVCHPTQNIKVFRHKRIVKSVPMGKAGDSPLVQVDHYLSQGTTKTQSEESAFDLPNI